MEPLEHSEDVENLLAGHVLGNLTPEETAQVKQLLDQNPDLLPELHRLQSILAVLPLSLPITSPFQQLETRILQAAQAESPAAIRFPAPQINQIRPQLWKWGVAIGTMIIAGLGLTNYQLYQKLATTQLENDQLHQQLITAQTTLEQIHKNELATTRQELSSYQEAVSLLRQPNNRVLNLRGASSKSHSSGSLVIVPTKSSAMLILQDVATLPSGKVYRMWAFINGEKVSCGDFKPNGRGEVFLQLPLDQWGGTAEVVVTVEPDRAMSKPVGEMVITSS